MPRAPHAAPSVSSRFAIHPLMLRFEEAPPPAPLGAFVHALWTFTVPEAQAPALHHIPPDGCVSLAVTPGERAAVTVLVGPHLTGLTVPLRPGTHFRGVRMRPEAAGILTGVAPRAWAGRVVPLADVCPALASAAVGPDVDATFDALLAALSSRAAGATPPDALVRRATAEIEASADLRVAALARRLGVSTRTLQRRFAAATGLTPKQYARVRRFRRAAANVLHAAPEDWGRVAADHGFSDQAHLAREVAALTGVPPTAFEARTRRIEHVGVRP